MITQGSTMRRATKYQIFYIFVLFLISQNFLNCKGGLHNPDIPVSNSSDTVKSVVGATGPTYLKDLYPLFKAKCGTCHNEASVIPNWLNYKIAYAKRNLILVRTTERNDMPLGSSLSPAEKKLIIDWVNGGAPYDSTTDTTSPIGDVTTPIDTGTPIDNPTTDPTTPIVTVPSNLDLNDPMPIVTGQPVTYYEHARPIFKKYCSSCHNSISSIPNWLNYSIAFGKKDRIYNRAVVNKTMPIGSTLPDSAINILSAWVNGGGVCGAPDEYCLGSTTTTPTTEPTPTPEPTPVVTEPPPPKWYYSDPDVWKNFATRCVSCHDSQNKPDILNYEEAVKMKDKIRERVFVKQDMPPTYLTDFAQLSYMTRYYIAQWVDDGGLFSSVSTDIPSSDYRPYYFNRSGAFYITDVKPILQNRCVTCHYPGNPSGIVDATDYPRFTFTFPSYLKLNTFYYDKNTLLDHKNSGITTEEANIIIKWIDGGKYYKP